MGKKPPATASRWRLRVRAEGAQNLAAAGGFLSMDAKPDPYVIMVLGGATHTCEPVDNVEPLAFFTWPAAEHEFEVPDVDGLGAMRLEIHVKDRDTLKDRYIGGTSIPLGPLLASVPDGSRERVLCQSRMFPLDYGDEKLKKKKSSGDVQLTITLVDSHSPAEITPPVVGSQQPPPVVTQDALQSTAATSVDVTPPTPTAAGFTMPQVILAPEPAHAAVSNLPPVSSPRDQGKETARTIPSQAAEAVAPRNQRVNEPGPEELTPVPARPSNEMRNEVPKTVQPNGLIDGDTLAQQRSVAPITTTPEPAKEAPSLGSTQPVSIVDSGSASVTGYVKTLRVEVVSARELTRPTTLGGFLDRKPDPIVTLEFIGMTRSTPALKDVDLKKPITWTNTIVSFDLPSTKPTSFVLLVHVKDENLMKATYMGGGKLDISEFFVTDEEATAKWRSTSSALSGCERIVKLLFSDEKLTKMKRCGELTLRFHFEMEVGSLDIAPPERAPELGSSSTSPQVLAQSGPSTITSKSEPNIAGEFGGAPTSSGLTSPIIPPCDEAAVSYSSDIKMLSIEMLCGRDMIKPKTENAAKNLLKSLFDRKPDPYAIVVLGSESRKFSPASDIDVAFFEWKNAIQVFEFHEKPYPGDLLLHIRDDDIAGSDPYMGGARIPMAEIWNQASICATSKPRGDPQLVKTFALSFADEKMTKKKNCGSVTIRFRWVYADVDLPIRETKVETVEVRNSEATIAPDVFHDIPVVGYLSVRKISIQNDKQLLETSLDLYVDVCQLPFGSLGNNEHVSRSSSRVLTDATKGRDPNSVIEWLGDELVIPVSTTRGSKRVDIHVELKDKNAIMRDAEIASASFGLNELVEADMNQPRMKVLELCSTSKRTAPKSLILEIEVQVIPLGTPFLDISLTRGGILTLFLLRGKVTFISDKHDRPSQVVLHVDVLATQKKKKSLLSFGRSEPEFQSRAVDIENENGLVEWWATCDVLLSPKQLTMAKEKEQLDVEIIVMSGGKNVKAIGSLQLNLFADVFGAPLMVPRRDKVEFGTLGSMELEYAVGYRTEKESERKGQSLTGSETIAVPAVPSGNLHLLVLYAKNLVSPDRSPEKSEDLDPEVRIAIEPKYIRRKDNPVRSMLKTKPLENAGATPTWNEYLRLEYRLPPPSIQATNAKQAAEPTVAVDPPYFPPPIVQVGVYDIQIPGERNGSQAIGKAEIPLCAFLVPPSNDPDTAVQAITLPVELTLAGKKTGVLWVEGVFEPLENEITNDKRQSKCRAEGRALRAKSKMLKAGENIAESPELSLIAGRLDIHVYGIRGLDSNLCEGGLSSHVWLNSNLDDRQELKSRGNKSSDEFQAEWDAKLTLYTSNLSGEMLRVEVTTTTGKPLGTLKLPLGGIEFHTRNDTIKEWFKVTTASEVKIAQSSSEILLAISFCADERIFNPIRSGYVNAKEENGVIMIQICQLIILHTSDSIEYACKAGLLGCDTTKSDTTTPFVSAQQLHSTHRVTWKEPIMISLGSSPSIFAWNATSCGSCPIVRLDVFSRKQNARFHDSFGTITFSVMGLLSVLNSKMRRWMKLCSNTNSANLSALIEVEVIAQLVTEALPVSQPRTVYAIPGVFGVRFIAGRNLTDVDAHGDQDPYVNGHIVPKAGKCKTSCQTGVSLNGGRHPQWNSSIFEMRSQDLLTDVFRMEVVDSNEEDSIPDVLIGSVDIALFTLFRQELSEMCTLRKKTRWLETWIPIYRAMQGSKGVEDDDECAGEIRVEYRFLTDAYYESVRRRQNDAASSPFSADSIKDGVNSSAQGTLVVHIVQARGLNFKLGMQPGVRLVCTKAEFSHVTKPGQVSVTNPIWNGEIVDMPWSWPDGESPAAVSVCVEIVDLAIRTANVNALAVEAFEVIDVTTFFANPNAKSYHRYQISSRGPKSADNPEILLGLQFIPDKQQSSKDTSLCATQRDPTHGIIHIRVLELRMDMNEYFKLNLTNRNLSLEFQANGSAKRTIYVPESSVDELLDHNGEIVWRNPVDSKSPELTAEAIAATAAVVFDYFPRQEEGFLVQPNPIVIGELVADTQAGQAVEREIVGEIEIPIVDYILYNGHLATSWYPIRINSAAFNDSILGEVKLELQFLPRISHASKPVSPSTNVIVSFDVEVKAVTGMEKNDVCTVFMELFGCQGETKPNNIQNSKLSENEMMEWHEVLEFPVNVSDIATASSNALKVELRSAATPSQVHGVCHWALPKQLISWDCLSDALELNDVRLLLSDGKTNGMKVRTNPVELRIGISRNLLQGSIKCETIDSTSTQVQQPLGLLYILIAPPKELDLMTPFSALLVGNQPLSNILSTDRQEWRALSSSERCALAVAADSMKENTSIALISSDQSLIASLDSGQLFAVINAPGIEVFHHLQLKPSDPTKNQSPSCADLPCKFMFIEYRSGVIEISGVSVSWPPNRCQIISGCFHFEARLLNSNVPWVKSSLGRFSRATQQVEWKSESTNWRIPYCNAREASEPVLQFVLYQLDNTSANGARGASKEAFGQANVLPILAAQPVSNEAFIDVDVELTKISSSSTSSIPLKARFGMRFSQDDSAERRKEATAERERKALQLAHGAAQLKKSFSILGGDETHPICIADLKKFVLNPGNDIEYKTAKEMIQKAADAEMGGDLDRLFKSMDTNGDDQVSWDEYVSHMQNIHALADTVENQRQQPENHSIGDETHSEDVLQRHDELNCIYVKKNEMRSEDTTEGGEGDDDEDNDDLDFYTHLPVAQIKTPSADIDLIIDQYQDTSGQPTREPTKRNPSKEIETQQTYQAKHQSRSEDTQQRKPLRFPSEKKLDTPAPSKKKIPALSSYVLDWKVDDVTSWLTYEMELSQYVEAIQHNAVNGKLLLTLSDEELVSEIGVTSLLHKRKLMNQISEWRDKFQYPPKMEFPRNIHDQKRPGKKLMQTPMNETPAFIKREQLIFQEKVRVREAREVARPKTTGQVRSFPAETKLVAEKGASEKTVPPPVEKTSMETFDDAMMDIYEAIHPNSPTNGGRESSPHADSGDNGAVRLAVLPRIQIGSITNTDELFEVVRQRIHQLSAQLLPISKQNEETHSDFGDDEDDEQQPPEHDSDELTGLQLAFRAFSLGNDSKISRLKFQEALPALLSIDVSWHQFDLLFRRLDIDGDSELCWDEFRHVFQRRHITFDEEDIIFLQDALVNFVIERLESQQWTLTDLFKAFDRDGGGSVSIAEFATLVRFLFTAQDKIKAKRERKRAMKKRHVYLLMSCLDASADRRITQQEFLRFFFIVWSNKLMEVQDQLVAVDADAGSSNNQRHPPPPSEVLEELRAAKRQLRRALRTNFSRPFRDAMRCLDVSVPGPFSGLLSRLQLAPAPDASGTVTESAQAAAAPSTAPVASSNTVSTAGPDSPSSAPRLQVWQVLKGQTSASHRHRLAMNQVQARHREEQRAASRRRVQKGKNEVLRVRLTRDREPERADAVLRTPAAKLSLDARAELKFDHRRHQQE